MSELNKQGQIDFPSRISARAVLAGTTITIVLFSLFLALGGGLGLLPAGPVVDSEAIRSAGTGLIVWGSLSWIAAAFIGAYVAAVSARATSRDDGLLHGATTWATACVTAGILSCVWLMSAFSLDLVDRDITTAVWSRGAFLTYFVADLLALGAALTGGNLGVRREARISSRVEVTREKRAPVTSRPSPLPM